MKRLWKPWKLVVGLALWNLNGELEEDVYMWQPEDFAIEGRKHLYGLKQSP